MKKLIYFFLFICTSVTFGQTLSDLELQKQKLKQALAYGDKMVAANTMYAIIAIEGPQSTYKDSLAYLYYNGGNYVSSFLVANDILKDNSDNLELLEIKAISIESMGVIDKARETYQLLFSKTNNNYHAYKLASLQLAMKDFDGAYATIKKADALEDAKTIQITFQVNKNYSQNIELKPAIAYLEGIIALNLKKEAEAKICFERAIKLAPDFVLAKGKLETTTTIKD